MKALSLWQPWAQLVVMGWKPWETRTWSTTHRGAPVIHAAKRAPARPQDLEFDDRGLLERIYSRLAAAGCPRAALPRGALIGGCILDEVVRTEYLIDDPDAGRRRPCSSSATSAPAVSPGVS